MSVLQINSFSSYRFALRNRRLAVVGTTGAVIVAAVTFGTTVLAVIGHAGTAALAAVAGMSGAAALVTLLALFAVGAYFGDRERKAHEPQESFDVR
jgi:hypothetical protein